MRRQRKQQRRKTHKFGDITVVPAVSIEKNRAITFNRASYITHRRVKVWDVYRGPFRVHRCDRFADAREIAKAMAGEVSK